MEKTRFVLQVNNMPLYARKDLSTRREDLRSVIRFISANVDVTISVHTYANRHFVGFVVSP